MNYDIGIIGGGVIGLSCAWRLAQGGARVALFERGEIGREASWAAAGMLAPQCEIAHHPLEENEAREYSPRRAMFDLCLQSRELYSSFADELFDITGIDIELSLRNHARGDWRTPGILYVQTKPDDGAPRVLATQKNTESAPDFNGFSASWLPQEGQVENRILVKALRLAAQKTGVAILHWGEVDVASLLATRRSKRTAADCDTRCDKVLVCAGARSGQLGITRPKFVLPVSPIAGEMLALRPFPSEKKKSLSHIVYSSNVYLVPRRNGLVIVGATMRKSGFNKSVTVAGITSLLQSACALLPDLQSYTIESQWAGLRPGTPDGLPILGKTPLKNLFVATGHFRNGILLTPQTAHIMARCLLHNEDAPPAFSVERFQ